MKIERSTETDEIVQSLFKNKFSEVEVDFGLVSIPPGTRLPLEGTTSHKEHEYSFFITGGLSGESGGKPFEVIAGESTYIPPGEQHWCENTGEVSCELVYALVKG